MFGRHGFATVLAAALMGAVSAGGMAQPTPMVTLNAPRGAKKGLFGGVQLAPRARWGYGGPGTTAAQIKRASTKARNVKRHKAACRK
jgi:hypothetical protein